MGFNKNTVPAKRNIGVIYSTDIKGNLAHKVGVAPVLQKLITMAAVKSLERKREGQDVKRHLV